jgi:hypothetical protein
VQNGVCRSRDRSRLLRATGTTPTRRISAYAAGSA